MLSVEQSSPDGPLIVMLHWLGGSSRSWREVSRALAPHDFHCAGIDLPGFGAESTAVSSSVDETVRKLTETIGILRREHAQADWVLVGHSMGGKFAMILARMAEDHVAELDHLKSIVLLSPSPPSPEPMSEKKRSQMLESLGRSYAEIDEHRRNAESYIDENTGRLPLLDDVRQRSVEDVMRMSPEALAAWLNDGSRENWSATVGSLETPALVLAGTEDKALGPDSQRQHTLPHLDNANLVSLEGGGHLAPLERPAEVVDRIVNFLKQHGLSGSSKHSLRPEFSELIASNRTSPHTREVLTARMNESVETTALTENELLTLRALGASVIPDCAFDLAARIDKSLAEAKRDGWRFDLLPKDTDAWKRGILSLDLAAKRLYKVPFVALDPSRQDDMLRQVQHGDLGKGVLGILHIGADEKAFDRDQMQHWFEDVRGEFAKHYVADPRTMDRIGFTGFADEKGFTQIRLEDQESAS
jgi:pimeloyl-ACP methyl ester carboxylesterase